MKTRTTTPYSRLLESGGRRPIDLDLSRNEGRTPALEIEGALALEDVPRYPRIDELREVLAVRRGVAPENVLLTAGGDDALLRTCLATLDETGSALVTNPTFEMIPKYVGLAGGHLRETPWYEGAFPVEELLSLADERTRCVFLVSPNNPTGSVMRFEDVERVARALPDALVVFDGAYAELADDEVAERLGAFENVVCVRTLSKAWGLAGLRVGYAVGSPAWIERLSACGNPYPISIASAAIALRRLATGENDVDDYVNRVREERVALTRTLEELGANPVAGSQANFVLAREVDAPWLASSMAALGIGVRAFPNVAGLEDAVRIGVPAGPADFERLTVGLRTCMAPEALLFDMDGVIADVSRSYRGAIRATAESYGVELEPGEIDRAKARGNANDDWKLTYDLVRERGIDCTLDEVTERFEAIYQGQGSNEGLWRHETLTVAIERLRDWRRRYPLAIVTGRPRGDALRFLDETGIASLFDAIVCREDAALKPDPEPVERALQELGVRSAWMLGDTRDDLVAARAAGVLPIGVLPPRSSSTVERALERAGAAVVLPTLDDLEEVLP